MVDLALDVDRSAAYAALQARDLQPGTSGSVFTAATSQTQIDLIDSQWRYVHDGAVALQVLAPLPPFPSLPFWVVCPPHPTPPTL